MLGKFLKKLIPVTVFWYIPHKYAVIVKRKCNANLFPFSNFVIIELQEQCEWKIAN